MHLASHRTWFFLLLALSAAALGCRPATAPPTQPVGTVVVEFIRGDETNQVVVQNVADGATLESVMRSIDEVPIEIRGSGVTAFVDSIDDVATSASDGWTYRVDGKFSNEGIGSLELHPPTTITWRFGSWDDDAAENEKTPEASP